MILIEIGPKYAEYIDTNKPPEFTWFREKDSITIAEAELFFYGGFGFSFNFNVDRFIDKVSIYYE